MWPLLVVSTSCKSAKDELGATQIGIGLFVLCPVAPFYIAAQMARKVPFVTVRFGYTPKEALNKCSHVGDNVTPLPG